LQSKRSVLIIYKHASANATILARPGENRYEHGSSTEPDVQQAAAPLQNTEAQASGTLVGEMSAQKRHSGSAARCAGRIAIRLVATTFDGTGDFCATARRRRKEKILTPDFGIR
jgi:hypothetical protein